VTNDQPARRLTLTSVIPVWLISVIGAVVVGILAPADQYLTWLPIVFAVGILTTFCIQLALVQKEGLVNRVTACLAGSVVILVIATIVLGILQLLGA
jgi:hypothetical protein